MHAAGAQFDGNAAILRRMVSSAAVGWVSLLRDWDRSLRAGNYPATTRYNYLLAAAQFAQYLGTVTDDAFVDAAADPAAVRRLHVEDFQVWMIETRSAATALNKHKALQQFFKWLRTEEEIDRSPMDLVRQPKTPKRLIPVLAGAETKCVLDTCRVPRLSTSGITPSSGSSPTPAAGCPRSRTWRWRTSI